MKNMVDLIDEITNDGSGNCDNSKFDLIIDKYYSHFSTLYFLLKSIGFNNILGIKCDIRDSIMDARVELSRCMNIVYAHTNNFSCDITYSGNTVNISIEGD